MSLRVSINNVANRIGRFIHAGRAQLRRSLTRIALVLLVGLSLGEPLLCIVHCQIWLPILFGQHLAAAHHHYVAGMDMSGMHASGMSMPGTRMSAADTARDTMACHVRRATGSDVPFHVPPSPVHELLTAFATAIALLIVIQQLQAAAPGEPPSPFIPPPFHPPRPFAIQTLTHM